MFTKSILATAAIALAATIGSASAGEQFTTLDGVTAVAMSSGELATVKGQFVHWTLSPPGRGGILDPSSADAAAPLGFAGCPGCTEGVFRVGDPFGPGALAPGALGLLNAENTLVTPIHVCSVAGTCL